MGQVLIGFVLADMLILGGALLLGWRVADPQSLAMHFGLGLFATLYTTLLHSIVYIYFIVAAKVVDHAVLNAGLDADLSKQAKRLKMKTFRYAFLAILAVMAVAFLGAYITPAGSRPDQPFDAGRASGAIRWHMLLGILAFAVQPAVAAVELRNIARQKELTAAALAGYEAWRASRREAAAPSIPLVRDPRAEPAHGFDGVESSPITPPSN